MAPPFSPNDDDIDAENGEGTASSSSFSNQQSLPRAPPRSEWPSRIAATSHHPYEENVLSNPELVNPSLGTKFSKKNENGGISAGADIAHEEEANREGANEDLIKLKRATQVEQQPKLNKVTVEIPLVLMRPKETVQDSSSTETSTGSSALPRLELSQNTNFSLSCHVPPSTPDGRWTGTINGNSKIHQLVGSSNGSAQVTYKINSQSRLIGGLDMLSMANARPFQLRLGAQYMESNTSMVQLTAQQQAENSWGIRLMTRDVLDPWIISSNFWWHPMKAQWKSLVSVASMTTHKLSLGLGFSNSFTGSVLPWIGAFSVHASIDSKISSTRRAPLSLTYQPISGAWNASAALHTSRPREQQQQRHIPSSSWHIGIQRGSNLATGWSILLSWTQGDVTLRLPILVSTTLARTSQPEGHRIISAAIPLLLVAITGVAQEIVARFVWGDAALSSSASSSSISSNRATSAPAKAKQDAQSQQDLMKRQAESRKNTQQEKDGLVIESALYSYEDASWDVTIPLQFWVSENSALTLAAGSKQHLLGFYPVKDSHSDESASRKQLDQSCKQEQKLVPWWKEYWTPTTKRQAKARPKDPSSSDSPSLTVKYAYKGKSYEVTIRDDQELKIPQQPSEV